MLTLSLDYYAPLSTCLSMTTYTHYHDNSCQGAYLKEIPEKNIKRLDVYDVMDTAKVYLKFFSVYHDNNGIFLHSVQFLGYDGVSDCPLHLVHCHGDQLLLRAQQQKKAASTSPRSRQSDRYASNCVKWPVAN